MKKLLRLTFSFIKDVAQAWNNDRVLNYSAALSFYTVLTIPPLLLSLLAVITLFFGEEEVRRSIIDSTRTLLTPNTAEVIRNLLDSIPSSSIHGTVALLSTLTVLVIASGIFMHLKHALNAIWGVAPKKNRSILAFLKNRIPGFLMMLLLAGLFGTTILAAAVLSFSEAHSGALIPSAFFRFTSIFIYIALLFVFFAAILKLLPDAVIGKRETLIGASTATVFFIIGNLILGFYLGRASVVSAYGTAGSIIALLLWMYYSSATLFLGAEVAQVYAKQYGHAIKPKKNARRVHTINI